MKKEISALVVTNKRINNLFTWMGMTKVYEAYKIIYPKGCKIVITDEEGKEITLVTFSSVMIRVYHCLNENLTYILFDFKLNNEIFQYFQKAIARKQTLIIQFENRINNIFKLYPVGYRLDQSFIVNVRNIKVESVIGITDKTKSKRHSLYEWQR